jgi:hypothetical protein
LIGPGLITGAADDSPSGIASCSQVEPRFGYGLAWMMLFSLSFMIVIQDDQRAHRHHNRARNRRQLAAALLAMVGPFRRGAASGGEHDRHGRGSWRDGSTLALLFAGSLRLYTVGFGMACVLAEIVLSYAFYAEFLKRLTVSLFAFVAVCLTSREQGRNSPVSAPI